MRVMYTCDVDDRDFLLIMEIYFSRNHRTDRATFLIISLLCLLYYSSYNNLSTTAILTNLTHQRDSEHE